MRTLRWRTGDDDDPASPGAGWACFIFHRSHASSSCFRGGVGTTGGSMGETQPPTPKAAAVGAPWFQSRWLVILAGVQPRAVPEDQTNSASQFQGNGCVRKKGWAGLDTNWSQASSGEAVAPTAMAVTSGQWGRRDPQQTKSGQKKTPRGSEKKRGGGDPVCRGRDKIGCGHGCGHVLLFFSMALSAFLCPLAHQAVQSGQGGSPRRIHRRGQGCRLLCRDRCPTRWRRHVDETLALGLVATWREWMQRPHLAEGHQHRPPDVL